MCSPLDGATDLILDHRNPPACPDTQTPVIFHKSFTLTEVLRTSTTYSKTHNNMHLLNIESLCHVSDLNVYIPLLNETRRHSRLIGTGWGRGHRSLLWVPGAVPMYLHVFK